MDRARMTVRIPQDLKEAIDRLAQKNGLTVNAIVTLAIQRYVAKNDKKEVSTYDLE